MKKYVAFISYRHLPADEAWAGRILQDLEQFRVPREFRDLTGGATIGRVFLDRDELPASGSLSEQLVEALDASENLIVICSQDTPSSVWVNQEVARFVELGRRDRIFPLLIDGTPEQSFPPALLAGHAATPGAGFDAMVPLAADVRPRPGVGAGVIRRRAVMMLVAAFLDVGLDELAKRHKRRKRRIWQMAAGGAMAVAVGLAALSYSLLTSRDQGRAAAQALTDAQVADAAELFLSDTPASHAVEKLDGIGGDPTADRLLSYWAHSIADAPDPAQIAHIRLGQTDLIRTGTRIYPFDGRNVASIFVNPVQNTVATADYRGGVAFFDARELTPLGVYEGLMEAEAPPSDCGMSTNDLAAARLYDLGSGRVVLDSVEPESGAAHRALLNITDGACEAVWHADDLAGLAEASLADLTDLGLACAEGDGPAVAPTLCDDDQFRHVSGLNRANDPAIVVAPLSSVAGTDVTGAFTTRSAPEARPSIDPGLLALRRSLAANGPEMPDPGADFDCLDLDADGDSCAPDARQMILDTVLSSAPNISGFVGDADAATLWSWWPDPSPGFAACRINRDAATNCIIRNEAPARCIAASPDGALLFICTSSNDGGSFEAFDATTLRPVELPDTPPGNGISITFPADDQALVISSAGYGWLYDLADFNRLQQSPIDWDMMSDGTENIGRWVVDGDPLVPTLDGRLQRLDLVRGTPVWSVAPLALGTKFGTIWGDADSQSGAARLNHDVATGTVFVSQGQSVRFLDAATGYALTPEVTFAALCAANGHPGEFGEARLEGLDGAAFRVTCRDGASVAFRLRAPVLPEQARSVARQMALLADTDSAGFAAALADMGLSLEPEWRP